MIPCAGCPPWPPDHPRTFPRTGPYNHPVGHDPGVMRPSSDFAIRCRLKRALGMFEMLLGAAISLIVIATILVAAHAIAAPDQGSHKFTDTLRRNTRVDPTSRGPDLL